jgi:hypothetical protein
MDPISIFSIANGCAGLAMKCGQVTADLYILADKYKQAKLSILALHNECRTFRVVLGEIESWATSSGRETVTSADVSEQLGVSLELGSMVMSALEEQMKTFMDFRQSAGFRRRAKIVWNDGVLRGHEDRVRGQIQALTCLLQVMKLYVTHVHLIEFC